MKRVMAISICSAVCLPLCPSSARAVEPAHDWPTVQHDMQRTGYTRVVCKPPYRYRWIWANGRPVAPERVRKARPPHIPWTLLPDFTTARFMSVAQPMAQGGVAYIGSVEGALFAIDLETGATKWRAALSGPALHSVTVTDKAVFVGTARGVDAVGRDGKNLWSFRCPRLGGFFACPAVSDGTVLIGSTSGFFYGLDASSGKAKWEFDAGAPIYSTAAADAGSVCFGAENMHAYSLDVGTGKLKWKSQRLLGSTFGQYWAVIAAKKGVVMFRTAALAKCWTQPIEDAPGDYHKAQEALRTAFKERPSARSFFILDLSDGKERVFVASGHFGFSGCISPPPIVRWTDGEVFSWFYARGGAFQKGTGWGGWGNTTDFAIIDFETGFFKRLGPTGSLSPPAITRYDDHQVNTMGGNYLFGLHAMLACGWSPIDGKGPAGDVGRRGSSGFREAGKIGLVGHRHWGGAVSATILEDLVLVNPIGGVCIIALESAGKE